MARIIEDDVRAVLPTSLEDKDILVYISTANALVTNELGESGLGSLILKDIERYLTAHFIAFTRERMGTRERLGDAEITYAGKFGEELMATPWGQIAATLDTTGTLRAMGKRRVTFKAITSFET